MFSLWMLMLDVFVIGGIFTVWMLEYKETKRIVVSPIIIFWFSLTIILAVINYFEVSKLIGR